MGAVLMTRIASLTPFYSKKRHKILFVCRGSTKDGMGHVMRSRALARAMRDNFEVEIIIIGDQYVKNLIAGKNINFSIVENDEEVIGFYQFFHPEIVIFDLMQFDKNCFDAMSKSSHTISLSPIFNQLGKVDLFFHRTSGVDRNWAAMPRTVRVFKGLPYTVISEHCKKIPTSIYKDNLKHSRLSIAISMGGTDAANKTLAILDRIKEIEESLLIWILLGEGYAHSYSELVERAQNSPHEIILAKTNDSMWRILNTCSLAILAGGTTTYESAYSGLPSINILEFKRHVFLIDELVEKHACICAGCSFGESMKTINGIIRHLNMNRELLLDMHLSAKTLIDGLGVNRIQEHIQTFLALERADRNISKVGT